MKRVTGIGGVFFRSKDREKLMAWYREHLGIDASDFGFMFQWKKEERR